MEWSERVKSHLPMLWPELCDQTISSVRGDTDLTLNTLLDFNFQKNTRTTIKLFVGMDKPALR